MVQRTGRTCQGHLPISSRTRVKSQVPKPLKMFLARNERVNHQCGSWLWTGKLVYDAG